MQEYVGFAELRCLVRLFAWVELGEGEILGGLYM